MAIGDKIDFPAICVKLRKYYDCTQAQMAERLQVPLRTYQDWEQGTTTPGGVGAYWLATLEAEIDKEEFKQRVLAALAKAIKKID